VPKADLPDVERRLRVICTKLQSGRTIVHVYAESLPGPDFEPAEPDLEDVYFSVMAGHQGARAGAATLEAAS
jgi:ABC-2 type transport system ATP-binding protein